MINDLDSTIKTLLLRDLPASLTSQVKITFAPPDSHFPPPSITFPAIDIFLYEIRENLELRNSERLKSQQTSVTQTTLNRTPVHVRCSYIITAWSASTTAPDQDEHGLLGAVLQVLLRYPTLPAEVLQGVLVNVDTLPKAETLQELHISNLGQFWQAMGGRPKPIIHYSVTFPITVFNPIANVPLVTSMDITTSNLTQNNLATESILTQVAIAGVVKGSDTQSPIASAKITISSNSIPDFAPQTTNAMNGYFYFAALPTGTYQLQASPADPTMYHPSNITNVNIQKDQNGNVIMQQVNLVLPKI